MSSGQRKNHAGRLPGGRYDARRGQSGWEVFDTYDGTTARLNDRFLTPADRADAETVAGILNEFHAEKSLFPCH